MDEKTNKNNEQDDFEEMNYVKANNIRKDVTKSEDNALKNLIDYQNAKQKLPKIKEYLDTIDESIAQINLLIDKISISEISINKIVPEKDFSHKTSANYPILIKKLNALDNSQLTIDNEDLILKVFGV